MLTKRADRVIFIEDKVEQNFLSLPEDNFIKKAVRKAIEELKQNVFCGENIKKELIPKIYSKNYQIDNLWWYPLPDGWRMVHSIISNKFEIIAAIVEYFNHKDYERRFGY